MNGHDEWASSQLQPDLAITKLTKSLLASFAKPERDLCSPLTTL